jgi:hypothetical protein
LRLGPESRHRGQHAARQHRKRKDPPPATDVGL